MKISRVSILVLLLFFNCSSDIDVPTVEMPPLTDVLTFEVSFGDEKTIDKDEFLLAKPRSMDVNIKGDIYVFDEWKFKIFDNKGRPKKIFGGYGQGTQEFSKIVEHIEISPEGFLTVLERGYYNLFSPDNSFIEKKNMAFDETLIQIKNEYNVVFDRRCQISALNEQEFIIQASTVSMMNFQKLEKEKDFDYLFYVNSGNIKILAKYDIVNTVITIEGGGGSFTSQDRDIGRLVYSLLPDKRVAYSNSAIDIDIKNNEGVLTLYTVDLGGLEKREIYYKYTPQKIPQSIIDRFESRGKNHDKRVANMLREHMYLPPFNRLITDGKYIILGILIREEDGGVKDGEICVILDSENGKTLQKAIFPSMSGIFNNGYYYNLKVSADEFPVIEKYKIDPAVYGK
ncbi:hypothetical protein AMJ80_08855 [bacterium SM23_31]|nr:MAG: hypothetical protein AMJ80_08855 [bacterium SM23_31]